MYCYRDVTRLLQNCYDASKLKFQIQIEIGLYFPGRGIPGGKVGSDPQIGEGAVLYARQQSLSVVFPFPFPVGRQVVVAAEKGETGEYVDGGIAGTTVLVVSGLEVRIP